MLSRYGTGYQLLEREPLPVRLTNCVHGALAIVYMAIVPPKIELRNIAMQMLAADVVKRAVDAALQERKNRFSGVAVDETVITRIFALVMIGHIVMGKWLADAVFKHAPAVSHEMRA